MRINEIGISPKLQASQSSSPRLHKKQAMAGEGAPWRSACMQGRKLGGQGISKKPGWSSQVQWPLCHTCGFTQTDLRGTVSWLFSVALQGLNKCLSTSTQEKSLNSCTKSLLNYSYNEFWLILKTITFQSNVLLFSLCSVLNIWIYLISY